MGAGHVGLHGSFRNPSVAFEPGPSSGTPRGPDEVASGSCAVLLVSVASVSPARSLPRLVYRVEVKARAHGRRRRRRSTTRSTIDRPQTDEVRLSVAAWAPGSYRLMNVFKNIDGRRRGRRARRARARSGRTATSPGSSTRKGADARRRSPGGSRSPGAEREQPELPERHGRAPRRAAELPLLARPQGAAGARPLQAAEGWKVATGLTPTFDPDGLPRERHRLAPRLPRAHGQDRDVDVRRAAAFRTGSRSTTAAARRVRRGRRSWSASAGSSRPTIDLWGHVPYPHYTFLFSAGGGGGLEHLTSTTIGVNTRALAPNPNAHQGVIAHEFFHAWNVKRLRPKALGPFDYDGPVRTKSLWISEGITNYYTNVILVARGPHGRGRVPRARTSSRSSAASSRIPDTARSRPRRPRGPSGTGRT